MSTPLRHRYERFGKLARAAYIACYATLLTAGVALIFAPVNEDSVLVHGVGAMVALVAGFLSVRMVRFGTIDISSESVALRGLLSTSRFPIDEVAHFTAVSGLDQSGQERTALALRARSGEVCVFVDFGSSEDSPGLPARELATLLNERITEFRNVRESDVA